MLINQPAARSRIKPLRLPEQIHGLRFYTSQQIFERIQAQKSAWTWSLSLGGLKGRKRDGKMPRL